MKNEIKYALLLIGLGVSLLGYGHANFASKDSVTEMREDIREIRNHLLGEK